MNRRKLLQTLVGLVPAVALAPHVEIPPPDFCPLPVKEANG